MSAPCTLTPLPPVTYANDEGCARLIRTFHAGSSILCSGAIQLLSLFHFGLTQYISIIYKYV